MPEEVPTQDTGHCFVQLEELHQEATEGYIHIELIVLLLVNLNELMRIMSLPDDVHANY